MRPERFVFVIGTGRCGSTLAHEMLSRHPDVGFLSNVQDRLPRVPIRGTHNNDVLRRLPDRFTQKGRLRFAPSEGYRALDRQVSPIVSAPCRDLTRQDATPWLASRLRSFFTGHAAAQGKPVFLHKFTGWPRTGLVDAVFPGARFVNVVRDGRAVANSFLQMPWWQGYHGPDAWSWGPLPDPYRDEWEASGRSFVILAGLQWKLLMDAFDRARQEIPPDRWLDIRYEDWISQPELIGRVAEFAGLRPDAGFDRAVGRSALSSGRTDAYRRDLRATDVEALGISLGDHLQRWGYALPQRVQRRARPVPGGSATSTDGRAGPAAGPVACAVTDR